MNFRTTFATVILLCLSACATTPHGMLFMPSGPAPDLETGQGCERYGVWPQPGMQQVAARPFDAQFVQTWEIDKVCPSGSGRSAVWGCYDENSGKAYVVGRTWKVYWHEWCHAKVGRVHVPGRAGSTVAP